MSISEPYVSAIKGFEGYTPKAAWDYKQHSVGYGTRASSPGETLTREQADARLRDELARARSIVQSLRIPMSEGQEAALTSLTFNAGADWMKSGLGQAVRAGDWDEAQKRFLQYTKADGKDLPGLVSRRKAEAQWLSGGAPSVVPSETAVEVAPTVAPVPTSAPSPAVSDSSSGSEAFASPYLPKSDDLKASQQIARAVMGFGEAPKLYDVPMIEAQRIGNPGSLAAGMEMADASGLARGFMGRSPADRAISLTRAEGGAVNPAEDTGANLPETESSLVEQQKQVMAGRRPAQMFPNGTPELPVPQGLGRVVTARGVFHFNPDLVSAAQIVEASAEGRENEILGLGPMSKADVMEAAQRTGEKPVAIPERTPFGAEVKASMTVPSAVMTQAPEILANKMPGNSVGIEPVEDVVRQRTGMADLDRDRAITTALRVANPPGFARGGAPMFKPQVPYANPIPYAEGPVVGPSGGRADTVKTAVRGGSHVLPADIVSSLGQGNTDAGMGILAKMFKTGPYGMPRLRRAEGGEVPVMVSHGEFVVPPEVVAEIGGGDQDRGHAILDQFIVGQRQNAIETMKRLPGPAKD